MGSSGEYEDYRSWVEAAAIDEAKAAEICTKLNDKRDKNLIRQAKLQAKDYNTLSEKDFDLSVTEYGFPYEVKTIKLI